MNHYARMVEILLVEDNAADAVLTEEALQDARMANRLHHVKDGEDALRFLRRERPFEDAPRPDLILLDLNLPGMDGRQVLTRIKTDASFSQIPVVILTSSRHDEDVAAVYGLHANAFIQKPVDLNAFVDVVRATKDYWLAVVTLPPHAEAAGGR